MSLLIHSSAPQRLTSQCMAWTDASAYAAVMAATAGFLFHEWSCKWIELAGYPGSHVPDVEGRIEKILSLWEQPIPPGWWRGKDTRIGDRHRRYSRGNGGPHDHRPPEHAIEYDVLAPSPVETPTDCLGMPLVDGVNAVPLAKDTGGRRRGNVEADMLLLAGDPTGYRLFLAEVKVGSNNAWFAVVESTSPTSAIQ